MVTPVFAWTGNNQVQWTDYITSGGTAVRANVLLNHFYDDWGGYSNAYRYVSWIKIFDNSLGNYVEIGLTGYASRVGDSYTFLYCYAYVTYFKDNSAQRTEFYTSTSFGQNYALEAIRGGVNDDIWYAKINGYVFDSYDYDEVWTGKYIRTAFEWEYHPNHDYDGDQCSYIENLQYQYNEGSYYDVEANSPYYQGTYSDHLLTTQHYSNDYKFKVDIP